MNYGVASMAFSAERTERYHELGQIEGAMIRKWLRDWAVADVVIEQPVCAGLADGLAAVPGGVVPFVLNPIGCAYPK